MHRSNSGIQESGTKAATIAAPALCTLTFLIYLSLFELAVEPLQHAKYMVRLRYTFLKQFCDI